MSHIIDCRAEGMVRRKHMKGLPCDIEIVHAEGHVQAYVRLREHHSLALASCSRCEDYGSELVYIDLVIVVRIVAFLIELGTFILKRFQCCQSLAAEFCSFERAFRSYGYKQSYRLELALLKQLLYLGFGSFSEYKGLAACRCDDTIDIFDREFLVHRYGYGTYSHHSKERAAPAI